MAKHLTAAESSKLKMETIKAKRELADARRELAKVGGGFVSNNDAARLRSEAAAARDEIAALHQYIMMQRRQIGNLEFALENSPAFDLSFLASGDRPDNIVIETLRRNGDAPALGASYITLGQLREIQNRLAGIARTSSWHLVRKDTPLLLDHLAKLHAALRQMAIDHSLYSFIEKYLAHVGGQS